MWHIVGMTAAWALITWLMLNNLDRKWRAEMKKLKNNEEE